MTHGTRSHAHTLYCNRGRRSRVLRSRLRRFSISRGREVLECSFVCLGHTDRRFDTLTASVAQKIVFPFPKNFSHDKFPSPSPHQTIHPPFNTPAGPSSPFEVGRSPISQFSVELPFPKVHSPLLSISLLPKAKGCQPLTAST